MFRAITVISLLLWLLGLVTSYTLGGFVHIFPVIALVVMLIKVIPGRNARVATMECISAGRTYRFEADAAGVPGPGSTPGLLLLLGMGLDGLESKDFIGRYKGK